MIGIGSTLSEQGLSLTAHPVSYCSCKRITDALSGMWVFRKRCLDGIKLISNNWDFSEEIKIEAIRNLGIHFGEYPSSTASGRERRKCSPGRSPSATSRSWSTSALLRSADPYLCAGNGRP